jgi:putative transposase
MPAQKYFVVLEPSEVAQLKKIVSSGVEKARTITRARVLLMTNEERSGTGMSDQKICQSLGISAYIPAKVRQHYVEEGLIRALYESPRPGKPKIFTPADEAGVVAIACTNAPDGYERWTLDLLQEEMTARLGKSIDRNTIDKILLKNDCKPWLKKNVVHSRN